MYGAIAITCIGNAGCPPTSCPAGEASELSGWDTAQSAYIVVPAGQAVCLGDGNNSYAVGGPFAATVFPAPILRGGGLDILGTGVSSPTRDKTTPLVNLEYAIFRLGMIDCPIDGALYIDYMNIPTAEQFDMLGLGAGYLDLLETPYHVTQVQNTTIDSYNQSDDSWFPGLVYQGTFSPGRSAGLCFENHDDKDLRVLFEMFLPEYTCEAPHTPLPTRVATTALPKQSCPIPSHTNTTLTCTGARPLGAATWFTLQEKDAVGCAGVESYYANSASDAQSCASSAGLSAVADICSFDVELFSGTVDYGVLAENENDAITCAELTSQGCSNCNATVVGAGSCLSDAR